MNSDCIQNVRSELLARNDLEVPKQLLGMGRHFFVQASKVAEFSKSDIFRQVRKIARRKNVNLEVIFNSRDNLQTGEVTVNDFCYLLWSEFSVPEV